MISPTPPFSDAKLQEKPEEVLKVLAHIEGAAGFSLARQMVKSEPAQRLETKTGIFARLGVGGADGCRPAKGRAQARAS